MTVESENYRLEVLEYAVNQCIDLLLSNDSEDALNVILYQSNEVVWRVATDIYTKSGYQIDFSFIKDILNLRIELLRNKIAEEARIRRNKEAEEARVRAELEAQRLAKEIEEERIRKEQEAEEERIEKKRKEEEERKLQELKQANPNIDIKNYKEFDTFIRIKNIIIEDLEIEGERITSNAILNTDLCIGRTYSFSWDSSSSSYDDKGELNGVEFIMGIEEEFDIEISDEENESLLSGNIGQLINFVLQKI